MALVVVDPENVRRSVTSARDLRERDGPERIIGGGSFVRAI